MNGKQLSDLREIFISFETHKLDKCRVVYINELLANGKSPNDILSEYSFIVRPEPAAPRNESVVKTFMAERYGGDGILSNGGGGRCGFDGIWQLKGLDTLNSWQLARLKLAASLGRLGFWAL